MNKYANDFILKVKDINEKETFMKELQKIEEMVYKQITDQVNQRLIPELQKNKHDQNQVPQIEFLKLTPQIDSNYMHSHIQFKSEIDSGQNIDHNHFQQDQTILDFPLYKQNLLDVNANSKFYRPEAIQNQIHQLGKQFTDQSNINGHILKSQFYDVKQPEQKMIYPRTQVPQTLKTHQPDYIVKQESKLQFKPLIDKMGGLENTVFPMHQSLQQNEERKFINTPQHSFLVSAINEKQIPVPIVQAEVPKPKLPDPFNTNPQYRLDNLDLKQTSFANIQSYLPTQNQPQYSAIIYTQSDNIQQPSQLTQNILQKPQEIKMKTIESAKQQRLQKYQQ